MSGRTNIILLIVIAVCGGYGAASLGGVALISCMPAEHGQAAAAALIAAPLICPIVTLGAFACATPARALALCGGICALLLAAVSIGNVLS